MAENTDNIEVIPIPLSKIHISDDNVRKEGARQDLDELAESIRAVGLLQPVLVMKVPGKEEFELIVGQRRYLAHKKLGRGTILAIVLDRVKKDDALARSLIENVHRVELNHADAAKATTYLYRKYHKDIQKVRQVTGLSPQRIRQYVDIEELASEATKTKLKDRKVSPADVQRTIRAAKGNIEKADEMLDMMKKYELDGHQKARVVEYGQEHPTWSAKKIIDEAMKPRIEKSVIVPLSPRLRDGLQKAVDSSRRGPDDITAEALEHWLRRNGYL